MLAVRTLTCRFNSKQRKHLYIFFWDFFLDKIQTHNLDSESTKQHSASCLTNWPCVHFIAATTGHGGTNCSRADQGRSDIELMALCDNATRACRNCGIPVSVHPRVRRRTSTCPPASRRPPCP
jgi:hypothetical protein